MTNLPANPPQASNEGQGDRSRREPSSCPKQLHELYSQETGGQSSQEATDPHRCPSVCSVLSLLTRKVSEEPCNFLLGCLPIFLKHLLPLTYFLLYPPAPGNKDASEQYIVMSQAKLPTMCHHKGHLQSRNVTFLICGCCFGMRSTNYQMFR